MHSPLNRANTVFFHGVSVLATLCFLNWLTSFGYTYDVDVSRLDPPKVERMGQMMLYGFGRRVEAVQLSLTGDVNVSGVFNWNTMQVFVYVQADVRTRSGRTFRTVVWDRVVNRTDPKSIALRGELAEYPISMTDPADTLAGADVAVSVAWDVMPVSGGLRRVKGPQDGVAAGVKLPAKPCMSRSACRKLSGKLQASDALLLATSGPSAESPSYTRDAGGKEVPSRESEL